MRLAWPDEQIAWPAGEGYELREPVEVEARSRLLDRSGAGQPAGRILIGDALAGLAVIPDASIDLVLIDPPFGTGRDFGDYRDDLDADIWLTMIRDRLVDAARVLKPSGSIWIHLDQTRSHLVQVIADAIFGRQAFLGVLSWERTRSRSNTTKRLAHVTDHILAYRMPQFRLRGLPRPVETGFSSADGDPRPWRGQPASSPSTKGSELLVYGVENPFTGQILYPPPGRHWSWSREQMKAVLSQWTEYGERDLGDAALRAQLCSGVSRHVEGLVVTGDRDEAHRTLAGVWPQLFFTRKGQGTLRRKEHLDQLPQTVTPTTLLTAAELGVTSTGAKHELRRLFPGRRVFATPKPERLAGRIVQMATDPGDTVLDFFAGSGTTAAAAHKMGRHWIAVEVSQDTARQWLVPRMQMVVGGEDGGISRESSFAGGGGFTVEAVTLLGHDRT